jgi:predicted metal-binding membrane protein
MGLRHGAHCAGSWAVLMSQLFILGAMNLAWILVLIPIVPVERVLPPQVLWPSGASSIGLIAWGGDLLVFALSRSHKSKSHDRAIRPPANA